MSSYGSSLPNYSTNNTPTSVTSVSSPATQIGNTKTQITSGRKTTPTSSNTDIDESNTVSSSIGETSILAANMKNLETAAQVSVEGYEYAVELQFATKTNFFYSASDKYAAGSSEDPGGPLLGTTFVDSDDDAFPSYQPDEEYAITTRVVKWTIASNAPISYGYHLDGSPFVHDNSNIENGGLFIVSITDGENNPLARTEYNAWYEPVEINGTAINPDNGKLPTEHIGQISRGAQESDLVLKYNDSVDFTDDDGNIIPFDSPLRRDLNITLKPYLGIPDYHYSCIPTGRGFIDAGGGDGYTDADGKEVETQLFGSPGISEGNTDKSSSRYGQGDFNESYCYPNYYDGRGQLISNNNTSQFPKNQITQENVVRASDDLENPGNVDWIQAYADDNAPWVTEGQWLASDPDNDTGFNYLSVQPGTRNNRCAPGRGFFPVFTAYDFALQNSGLIKDRDDVVRWSGHWTPDAKDEDGISPYMLKANDLVVTQVGHWDHRGVEQMRKYCRQRYQLYNLLLATHDDVLQDHEDFTWYRTGKDFPEFPNNESSNNPATDDLYPLPGDFNETIAANPDLYPDLVPVPSSAGEEPTFRTYEAAVINRYTPGNQAKNDIDSNKGWGLIQDTSFRYPFIDMTACLSVVPPIELPAEFTDADFDGSGQVDGDDLLQILANWGSTPNDKFFRPELDLNGDGIIDGGDLTVLLNAWINQGVSLTDYSKTFRPPLNWDPTDRNSAPYITEIDDIDDYTIDGPGVKPLAAGIDPDTDIPVGGIGYPNTAMDGGTAQAWEIYTADENQSGYNPRFPKGLNMTMADSYWPELKVQQKQELIGDGNPDDPETWDYQCTVRRVQALYKTLPKYLRLGTAIVWQAAGQHDNRVQGCHGGADLAMANYGSQEGCEYEMLTFLAFDKNLDKENLDRANLEQPGLQGISPSLAWLHRHYGSDWDKKPNPTGDGTLIDKREGQEYNLRHIIRRALTQRAIDIYGGYRSCGKYHLHNAGHTDWWDMLSVVGVACTQYQDWVDLLETGELGSTRNGTIKNFASRVGKDDPDYVYDTMENTGTFPGGIGAIGPEGQANLTNTPAGYLQGNGPGAYAHNTVRYKDLSVKSVDDYSIMQVPGGPDQPNANVFEGESLPPQNLPDIFPNQLITVYPPVGGDCGNHIDSLYYKLKEIVDSDKQDLLDDPNNPVLQQKIRDLKWRGIYQQGIPGTHNQGDIVDTWISTDTEANPNGEPAPDITDAPLNRLQSGVEPEWVADIDKPYSFLHTVPDENLVRYDGQYFNIIRAKLDQDTGQRVFETNNNLYKPHKDIWKPIEEDFRPIDRWSPTDGSAGDCNATYGDEYLSRALEGADTENSRYAPLTGIHAKRFDDTKETNTAKHWGILTNQDFMSSNYHRGLYVKNTTLNEDGTESEHYGKITVVVASSLERVRNSECCDDSRIESKPTVVDEFPMGSNLNQEIEGMKEVMLGKNANTDVGPTARAMRFLLLDDIGLTDDNGDLLPNATVDITHNLKYDFEDPERLSPSINTYANVGSYSNLHCFGGFKSYEWAWNRGSFMIGMAARMFAEIKDVDKQSETDKVTKKSVSEIVDALPAYYAKQYVKFPTFFNNPIGRAIFEEDTNTLHNVASGGNAQGVRWSGGTRADNRTPNWQDYPRSGNTPDNFYGGDQFKELVRALFNQELMARIDGPSSVISKWRDPADGRKWCSTIKEKLYRWKNDPDVIGGVLPTDTDGKTDFSTTDVIPVADLPENVTAIANSTQGQSVLWASSNYTFDCPDGQQASMARNSSNQAGTWPFDTMEEGQYPIPTTATIPPEGGWNENIYIPEWVTHERLFNRDSNGNYTGEKTQFNQSAGIGASFTIIGRNGSSVDLDKAIGRPVSDGRPIAATDEEYDLYLNNDGYRIQSGQPDESGHPGRSRQVDGVLPYKQFVEGKSLYVWLHGLSRWQELVLVSEKINTETGTITSHGPRSGATKGGDGLGTNDFSESGFEDDSTEWTQVWALPNYTTVLPGEEPSEPKPLGVWANMSDSFARDGLQNMAVFYADPQ